MLRHTFLSKFDYLLQTMVELTAFFFLSDKLSLHLTVIMPYLCTGLLYMSILTEPQNNCKSRN